MRRRRRRCSAGRGANAVGSTAPGKRLSARSPRRRANTPAAIPWDGDNTYGGKYVTNPSGGLLSKGHPLGATGLAQCTELVWQLRGTAEQRQVEGAARIAGEGSCVCM